MIETATELTRTIARHTDRERDENKPLRFYDEESGQEFQATGRVYLDDGIVCVDIAKRELTHGAS